MLKLHKIKALPIVMIIALLAGSLYIGNVQAAAITNMSNTMTNQNAGEASDHTFVFTIATEIIGSQDLSDDPDGGFISVDLWDFDMSNLVFANISMEDDAVPVSLFDMATQDCTDGDIGVNINLAVDLVNFFLCDTVTIGAGSVIEIVFGDGALINPVAGSYTMNIETREDPLTMLDVGYFAVVILEDSTVTVTATVDPTISFALSTNECDLGTLPLSPTALANNAGYCDYDVTVATNATGGLTVSAIANGGLTSGLDTIADTAGVVQATFEANAGSSEEYGFIVDAVDADLTVDYLNMGTDYEPVPTAISQILSAGEPIEANTATIRHGARISATTPAGAYSQVVTWTVVGNF